MKHFEPPKRVIFLALNFEALQVQRDFEHPSCSGFLSHEHFLLSVGVDPNAKPALCAFKGVDDTGQAHHNMRVYFHAPEVHTSHRLADKARYEYGVSDQHATDGGSFQPLPVPVDRILHAFRSS